MIEDVVLEDAADDIESESEEGCPVGYALDVIDPRSGEVAETVIPDGGLCSMATEMLKVAEWHLGGPPTNENGEIEMRPRRASGGDLTEREWSRLAMAVSAASGSPMMSTADDAELIEAARVGNPHRLRG